MTGHVSFSNTGSTLGDNVGLVAALIAVVVAQVLKPFSEWAITGRFKASLMVGSGGFPSSHSSLVTALATGTACQAGLGDPAFATALVLALVVMYDAMGVRRQAGMHATAINNLVTAFPSDHTFRSRGHRAGEDNLVTPLEAGLMGSAGGYASGAADEADGLLGGRGGRSDEANAGDSIQDSLQRGFQDFLDQIQARPLREHIGHTPVQVLAGAILGVVVGATYAWALGDDVLAAV